MRRRVARGRGARSGAGGHRAFALPDQRNWRTGLRGGSRAICQEQLPGVAT